ncbi:IEC3 subunit of the Ino80 complex, chromatin re-modelling-domain-containing protein [Phyllosticta capitalensis]|uniref:IEC3 subunit of the Ino80 complex, chromatin re-modelling-domain-containing protein n=2 Tax=Phyllosticta capitalensis TaxID=121624 RepID=A0ABR1YZV5_9PEZI
MASIDEESSHMREDPSLPRPPPVNETTDAAARPAFKSWRKKYRKMRMRFDERMRESNSLFREEQKATALVKRLQEQNDQLMDLLLDINETPKIPLDLRFDLTDDGPLPQPKQDPETIAQKLQEARAALAAGKINPVEFVELEDKITSLQPEIGPKALASLLQTPHSRYTPDMPLPEEVSGEHPTGYLSPNHEEEYLKELDLALADPSTYDPNDTSGRPIRLPARDIPSDKELQIRNPDSVYNWLRKHQPQVFLQDKENDHPEKPASGRGGGNGRGGKRGGGAPNVVATPSKPDQEEAQEEYGFVPETGSGRGKRSNKDDDAYRPKGGSGRAKRKREDGEGGGGGGGGTGSRGGRKKARGGAAAA